MLDLQGEQLGKTLASAYLTCWSTSSGEIPAQPLDSTGVFTATPLRIR